MNISKARVGFRRPSNSLPEDFKEEVREMYADGLKINNIAWYLGVSSSTVQSIVQPEKYRKKQKQWRAGLAPEKKAEYLLKAKEYHKLYWNTGLKEKIHARQMDDLRAIHAKTLAKLKKGV